MSHSRAFWLQSLLTVLLCIGAFAPAGDAADATAAAKKIFDLSAGPADATLRKFSVQSGQEVIFAADAPTGVKTNPVRGELTAGEALEKLLVGTGLSATQDRASGAFMINRATPPNVFRAAAAPSPVRPENKNTATSIPGFGRVEGRVRDSVSGEFLNNALVSYAGGNTELRTNSFGEFHFDGVPAGVTTVQVAVKGYGAFSAPVIVVSGETKNLDVALSLSRSTGLVGDAIVLDSFVVGAQREMSGNAIAINERRAAANLRNVISADEFGDSTEGNVGEFAKYVPGVAIDYTSAEARFISVRGLPSFGTAVMIDGNRMASAAANFSRAAEFDQVSMNNMARIEVTKSPTPDSPADTIGGSVNMVLKSAFERSKPILNYRANLNGNFNDTQDVNFLSLKKSPGPAQDQTIKVKPGFDLNYIKPTAFFSSSLSAAWGRELLFG